MKKFACMFLGVILVSAGASAKEQVVLLHGIARSSSHMAPLASYLEQQGYVVYNMDYDSTDHRIEWLAARLNAAVRERVDENEVVHYVGYSMGGLVIRAMLKDYKPAHLGKVVQLAPPNQGSEVADFLKDSDAYIYVYGPAGQQLVTNYSRMEQIAGVVDYELGVIAGDSSIDPVSSYIIPGEDDGKVSIESTKIPGMKDHVVVSSSHTFFPSNEQVQKHTAYFLQHGMFEHQP